MALDIRNNENNTCSGDHDGDFDNVSNPNGNKELEM